MVYFKARIDKVQGWWFFLKLDDFLESAAEITLAYIYTHKI